MSIQPPPTTTPLIDDPESLNAALQWIVFFNAMFNGDAGDAWVPIIANMTSVGGTPTITGRVYRISQYLSFFTATIVPAQGGNTSGVAGSTGITNYPLKMNGNGVCFAVSGNLGTVTGMCDQPSNVIYPPSWTNVTVPLTILGFVEAS